MSDNYLTVKEAAKELGVHWQTVRNYIERGDLKSHKIGKLVKITRADLAQFIQGEKQVTANIEVELRYKVPDIAEIQKRLLTVGAVLKQQSHIIDHWFIPMNIKNMSEEIQWFDVKRNTGIRVREYVNEYGNQVTATLDTKRMTLAMNHDTFLETSMNIDSYAKGKEFLESIDRKEYLTIDKNRLLYVIDQFKVEVDTIANYGVGVTVEYFGEAGDREQIIRLIEEFAAKLGLTQKDRFDKSLTVDAMQVLARF